MLATGQNAWAQATASARILNELSGCPLDSGFATPAGSPTSLAAIIADSEAGYSLRGSSFSQLGVVGASARAAGEGFVNWNSGTIRAVADGGWGDNIQTVFPERFSVTGVDTFRLNFSFSATGSVSATHMDLGGHPLVSSSAFIAYEFQLSGATFAGTQQLVARSPLEQTGTWGTIAGSVTLSASPGPNGTYTFGSVGLSMSGHAAAFMGNAFVPVNDLRFAVGQADFGSTLIWQGVTSYQALDSGGNEIALPEDFFLELRGAQTGFDYRNPALASSVAAPEVGTLTLTGLGGVLAVAGFARRRKYRA